MEYVFVYGTLKENHHNNRVMTNSNGELIGEASVLDGFCLYDLGPFPAAIKAPEVVAEIHGELWKVESLQRLDWLEGYPEFYDREECPVQTVSPDGGETIKAHIYFMRQAPAGATPVEGGRW